MTEWQHITELDFVDINGSVLMNNQEFHISAVTSLPDTFNIFLGKKV